MTRTPTAMIALALLALLAAGVGSPDGASARGLEVRFGARAGVEYNNNVFGTQTDPQGDYSVRVQPMIGIRKPEGDVQFRFNYEPYYRHYITQNEADGWSHVVRGEASWQVTRKLLLQVTDRFARVDNVDFFEQAELADGQDIGVPEGGTDTDIRRRKVNDFTARASWRMTPIDTLTFDASHRWNEFAEGVRENTTVARVAGQYLRAIDSRNQIGFGLAASQSEVKGRGAVADRTTRFYNLFGTWNRTVTRTLRFSVSAGPTIVDGDSVNNTVDQIEGFRVFPTQGSFANTSFVSASSCDVVDGFSVLQNCAAQNTNLNGTERAVYATQTQTIRRVGGTNESTDLSLTYFARASVSQVFERWNWELSYNRSAASAFSGFGSSTVADIFSAVVFWDATSKLNFRLRMLYVRRNQESDAALTGVEVSSARLDRCLPGLGQAVLAGLVSPSTVCGSVLGSFQDVARSESLRTLRQSTDIQEDQYLVLISARYKLYRNVALNALASYRLQEFDGDTSRTESRDRWRIALGIEYRFDPIRL